MNNSLLGARNAMRILTIGIFLVSATTAFAQAVSDKETRALSNVQHEMSTCVAYYTLIQQCMERSSFTEGAQRHKQVAEQLILQAVKVGSTIGMTMDAMRSRIQIKSERQHTLIQSNCSNTSSLYSRYADRCKRVVENPDSILIEYMSR
jgi:hypothetical protein